MATRADRGRGGAWVIAALALLSACRPREPEEAARARATEAFLAAQIVDLRRLIARAKTGDLVSRDRIAISISESIVKRLLDSALPREVTIAGRIRVRVESARPLFRGNNAGVVFQAVARGLEAGGPSARIEIGGTLERTRVDQGALVADVELTHFQVLDTSLGDMAADVLEALVRDNKTALEGLVRAVEIPVHLEQSLDVGGLDEGVVTARPGRLPLEMTVAEVIPVQERLWVLLDAKAGPWQGPEATGSPE